MTKIEIEGDVKFDLKDNSFEICSDGTATGTDIYLDGNKISDKIIKFTFSVNAESRETTLDLSTRLDALKK